MRLVTIDGKEMKSKDVVHDYLQSELQIEEYYGNNLDALWDGLITYDQPIKVTIIHYHELIENLGDYGFALLGVFRDTEIVNPNFRLEVTK